MAKYAKMDTIVDGVCTKCGNSGTELENHIANFGGCFTCAFWNEQLTHSNDKSVRVNGVHYRIGMETSDRNSFKGFGGSLFKIQFDDGRYVETCNLWCQGKIPDAFRDELPNNARFV